MGNKHREIKQDPQQSINPDGSINKLAARRLAQEVGGKADELTVRLRVLEETRAAVRLRAWIHPHKSGDDFNGDDIEALAFVVLMEAAKSAQEDLKAIMENVKAINDAKARQRRRLAERQALAAEGGSRDTDDDAHSVDGLDAHTTLGLAPDSTYRADLDSVLETLLTGYGIAVENEIDRLQEDLDSMSEMGETESLRLQIAMDRLSRMMSTVSNLMKKLSDTQQQIVQNMK